MKVRRLAPTYLNTFLVLAAGLHFILPIKTIIDAPYTYLSLILIPLGLIVNIWSGAALKKNNTTIDFQGTPTQLVTDGPYRISRNPIYLGGILLSLGIAMLFGSLITFIFPVALLIILNNLYVPAEEAALEKAFGEEYLRYKQKVRRWL